MGGLATATQLGRETVVLSERHLVAGLLAKGMQQIIDLRD